MGRVFSPYVKWQLVLLLIALVTLAIGYTLDIRSRPSLLGMAVVGAVVYLAREWAEGWENVSRSWSRGMLVAGVSILCLSLTLPDPAPAWILKVSHLAAAAIGMGLAGVVLSAVRDGRRA